MALKIIKDLIVESSRGIINIIFFLQMVKWETKKLYGKKETEILEGDRCDVNVGQSKNVVCYYLRKNLMIS